MSGDYPRGPHPWLVALGFPPVLRDCKTVAKRSPRRASRLGSRSFCLVGCSSPEPSVAVGLPPPVLGALALSPEARTAKLGLQGWPLMPPRTVWTGRPPVLCPPHTCRPWLPPSPPLPCHSGFLLGAGQVWALALVLTFTPLVDELPLVHCSSCPGPGEGCRPPSWPSATTRLPRAQAENSTEANLTRREQRASLPFSEPFSLQTCQGRCPAEQEAVSPGLRWG